MKPQYSFFAVLLMLIAGGFLVMIGKPSDKADLSGVMEVVGDTQRSLTKPLMMATQISPQEEVELGERIARRISAGRSSSPANRALELYLNQVGNRVAQNAHRQGISYRFYLHPYDVVNAFALPGGHIFVFKGLVDFVESEAELATILGHEITHVDARHCVELFQAEIAAAKITEPIFGPGSRLFEFGAGYINRVVSQGYRQAQEFQADAQGQQMAIAAGYEPEAAENVMKRLGDKLAHLEPSQTRKKAGDPLQELAKAVNTAAGSYFHSHPPTGERVKKLADARKAMNLTGQEFYRGRENLKQRRPRQVQSFPTEVVRP
jgi:predicted Zn-dependent protease